VSYGHLVVGGASFPVTGMELRDGRLRLIARVQGPALLPGGPVTVFGSDGQGVAQGGDVGSKAADAGEWLEIRVDLVLVAVSD
jgi:hypothetical protein